MPGRDSAPLESGGGLRFICCVDEPESERGGGVCYCWVELPLEDASLVLGVCPKAAPVPANIVSTAMDGITPFRIGCLLSL